MEITEAITTAIMYEGKVRDTYKEALEKSQDSVGRRIIQVLIREEQEHVEYLARVLKNWKETGELGKEILKTHIPSKEAILEAVQKVKGKMSANDNANENEIEILKKALKVEQETFGFYTSTVKELPAEGQKLFSHFLEIEEGHLAIVQAELDSVTGTGFWFDTAEIDLEAG